MKPYDKSNSLMRRVTKRVSEFIPGVTWMNSFLGDSHSADDPTSENNDQPPVKKLCTSNNTFMTHANYCTPIDIISPVNPTDDSKNYGNSNLPEISAVTCLPSTSRQNPKFTSQSNSSSQGHDIGNRSSLKRKSDVADLSHITRQSPKKIPFNFASSTPTLVTTNKQQQVNSSLLKKSLNPDKFSSNEFSSSVSSTFSKPRDNESQTTLKFRDTTKPLSSASFRWDTFVNYGELSERQKLFAQKSPLNCSQVMYGGSSARSTLSKILGTTPPIHRKTVIPISPTNNSEIRTTSSILLEHISTKDKEIEENKFIIQPRVHQRHKADQKIIPLKVETTVKSIETTPEKKDDKLNDVSSESSGRDISRKIRADISKKARGLTKPFEFEMLTEVDLPNISLTVPVLPTINLSTSCNDSKLIDDNEFTFNQPLTIEQFSLQIAEKKSRKKQKMTLKKSPNTSIDISSKDHSITTVRNSSNNISIGDTSKIESEKVPVINIDCSKKNDKVSESSKFGDSPDIPTKSVTSSNSNLESKPANVVSSNLSSETVSNNKNAISDKLSVGPKKWTCDTCWVSNDSEKINCIACQTPKTSIEKPQKSISITSSWTCETCWVPNKNEIDACVACQTQKPGIAKKVIEKNSDWTCDACWVKNKSTSISCISCGTTKPGSAPENKPQPSNQLKFGLNNNNSDMSGSSPFKFGFDSSKTDQSSDKFKFGYDTSKTEQSSGQFKFGFDTSKTDQSSSQFKFGFDTSKTDQLPEGQFKFGSNSFKTSENGKSDSAIAEFKFGMDNNKIDQPVVNTFKFGTDGTTNQSVKTLTEVTNNNTDKPESQIKFDFEKKLDQPINQFKFGQSSTMTNKPIAEFKFGSENIESDKSDRNKIAQSTNELKCLVNNKNEVSEKLTEQSKKIQFKFGDAKPLEKSTPKIVFGSIETNCNSTNSSTNIGQTIEDKGKLLWEKKDKNETKPINFGMSQSVQSTIGSSSTNQMVNGHSHSNETPNEDQQKSGLIKTSQLFNFGSLVKQDQNVPDDQKNPSTFSFGSANDNKSFGTPMLANSSFPSTAPVFGASNSIFSSGTTTSTSATLGSSALSSQFSFGSMTPNTNSFFSKPVKENDKNPISQTSNSFTSTTNVGFPFGSQSPPVFSVPNTGGFIKSSVSADESTKSTSNLFNQSSTKQTIKLDPNAPISINFTGGATTQFTAKPETSEPPPKRKILKPVRRIR